MTADRPVLMADRLHKSYRTHRGLGARGAVVDAVDGVSLNLFAGRITAVVGESGSGKSTTARMLLGLERPSSGRIRLEGKELNGHLTPDAVQMIFQDPFASLNPVHTVAHHIERALALHRRGVPRRRRPAVIRELLERVQLTPASDIARRRPHQLSGGQRQRVSIARALAVGPKVLLADEPVSMLDVSMRLGILNLLRDLVHDEQLAMLYITHDIATARYFSDTTLVMYRGRLVEGGPAEAVTQHSAHPYTRLLIASAPDPDRIGGGPPGGSPAEDSLTAPGRSVAEQDEVVFIECAGLPGCLHSRSSGPSEDIKELVAVDAMDQGAHWAVCGCAMSFPPTDIEPTRN